MHARHVTHVDEPVWADRRAFLRVREAPHEDLQRPGQVIVGRHLASAVSNLSLERVRVDVPRE